MITTKMELLYNQAYLVLREREAAGVEPISRDFIDPDKVWASLPSDEELKEAGVVINIQIQYILNFLNTLNKYK